MNLSKRFVRIYIIVLIIMICAGVFTAYYNTSKLAFDNANILSFNNEEVRIFNMRIEYKQLEKARKALKNGLPTHYFTI